MDNLRTVLILQSSIMDTLLLSGKLSVEDSQKLSQEVTHRVLTSDAVKDDVKKFYAELSKNLMG